ncbi:MAG: hypothetical protein AAFR14_04640, partial [Bacteroidota bacterium]
DDLSEVPTDNNIDDEAPGTPGLADLIGDEDDYDPAQVFVQTFDLALLDTLIGNGDPVEVGDIIQFHIVVVNQGTAEATNIVVRDYLPTGTTLLGGSAFTEVATDSVIAIIGSLSPGADTTLLLNLFVDLNFTDTLLTNNAEIIAATNPGMLIDEDSPLSDIIGSSDDRAEIPTDNDINDNPDNPTDQDDYDPAEVNVRQEFDLALDKDLDLSTSSNPTALGSIVTFDLNVTNEGVIDAFMVQLLDFVPAGLTLEDTDWMLSGDTARLQVPIPVILAGQTITRQITFRVNNDFQGLSITNMAEIETALDPDGMEGDDDDSTPNNGSDTEDDDDDYVLFIEQTFDLALDKEIADITRNPALPGDTVLYNLIVTNEGTLTAYDVQISDYIPDGLTLIDSRWVEIGDTARLVTPIDSILSSESDTVRIEFTIDENFAGDSITNIAEIESGSINPGGPNATDDDSTPGNESMDEDDDDLVTFPIKPRFDLALIKRFSNLSDDPLLPGSRIVYEIEIFNQGDVTAYDIEVADYFPPDLILNDSNWETTGGVARLRTPIDSITVAQMSQVVTIEFIIDENFPGGTVVNNAEITFATDTDGSGMNTPDDDSTAGDETGEDPDPNDDDIDREDGSDDYDPTSIEVQDFDLAIRKVLQPSPTGIYQPGDAVRFVVSVINQGSAAAFNIEVLDYFDNAELTFDQRVDPITSGSGNPVVITGAGANFIVEEIAGLDSVDVILEFTIDPGYMGSQIVNSVEIVGASADAESLVGKDEDGDLGITSESLPPELASDNDVDDEVNGRVDNPNDQDDFDPAPVCILNTVCPTDLTVSSCLTQEEVDEAFANWLNQFEEGGCGTIRQFAGGLPTVPSSCGGAVTVSFELVLQGVVVFSCDRSFSVNDDAGIAPICPSDWDIRFSSTPDDCIAPPYQTGQDVTDATGAPVVDDCRDSLVVVASFTDSVVFESCEDLGASNFDERTVIRTYVFEDECGNQSEACPQTITYDIDECVPLETFGVISSGNETVLTVPPGCDVPGMTVDIEETGVCGYVDYMWLVSTEIAPNGSFFVPNNLIVGSIWFMIPGANEPNYDPGPINQTTFFVRCARNFSCCNFGESNVVSYFVEAGAECANEIVDDCDQDIILRSPDDDKVDGIPRLYRTNRTIDATNVISNGSLEYNAAQGTEMGAGFEVGPNGQLEVTTTGCED